MSNSVKENGEAILGKYFGEVSWHGYEDELVVEKSRACDRVCAFVPRQPEQVYCGPL